MDAMFYRFGPAIIPEYFIYSFFNVDNYGKITVYNKNSSKMLIDVNTLVKNKQKTKLLNIKHFI